MDFMIEFICDDEGMKILSDEPDEWVFDTLVRLVRAWIWENKRDAAIATIVAMMKVDDASLRGKLVITGVSLDDTVTQLEVDWMEDSDPLPVMLMGLMFALDKAAEKAGLPSITDTPLTEADAGQNYRSE